MIALRRYGNYSVHARTEAIEAPTSTAFRLRDVNLVSPVFVRPFVKSE